MDRLCHVELVHGVNNYGGGGEEGQQEEKQEVKRHIAQVPDNAPH